MLKIRNITFVGSRMDVPGFYGLPAQAEGSEQYNREGIWPGKVRLSLPGYVRAVRELPLLLNSYSAILCRIAGPPASG